MSHTPVKISELPVVNTPVVGDEFFECVQDGENRQATFDDVVDHVPKTAPLVTLDGAAYNLADLTVGAWHLFTNAGGATITIQDDGDAAIPAGAEYGIMARGDDSVFLVSAAAAVIIPPKGGTEELEPNDFAIVKRLAVDL
jgi:hypothetical protein